MTAFKKTIKASPIITDTEKRNQLVMDHVYLVKFVVNRLSNSLPPSLSKEDLISMGSWGLIDAAERFDESKGILFKTYAVSRIRGAILDELRKNSLGGQTICRKAKSLEKVVRQLEETHGRDYVTDANIAKELGITEEKLHTLYTDISRSFTLSLDEKQYTKEDESETLMDGVQDKQILEPSALLEQSEKKQAIRSEIEDLPGKERTVLILYYYEGLNFKEIGQMLGVSESRVSQIRSKAILRLKGRLKRNLRVPY